ncbi:hypothetical protein [Candidatus Carsonella ruddii]|uniref:Uncharacterized protein n=1 Tax=Carsonella ruddii TaxID=114186 RepID=A0AAE7KLF4_CARRU|nr:hypothetical protein [Candidatus Carsonella ruddii]AGS06637.1 hypothetical protein CRDC_00765 [Candidatus Carsonella ruddii DC]ALA96878.1 hypothetical protein AMC76_00820 [Candidatus Carsonella ruddii]QLK14114.1 hypothetical protein FK493_00830 [Candidatus Carsonella ruddii]
MNFISKCLYKKKYYIFNFYFFNFFFIILNFNFKFLICNKSIIFKNKLFCIFSKIIKKKYFIYAIY